MEEKKSNKITFGTYAVIVTIVALVLLVGILAGMLIQKKNEDKRLQEDNRIATSQIENKVENTIPLNETESKNEDNEETSKEIKVGEYILQGMQVDPENWGVYSIHIKDNNKFTAESSYASSYSGKYEIKENTLICNATEEFNGEDGFNGTKNGNKKINKTFEFEILNDSKLKFTKVSDKSLKLTIGKTYLLNDNNKDATSNTKTTAETDKYKEITKELEEEELFSCDKYEEKNGKITLRGVISEPYTVTSTEFKNIVSKGKYTFEGEIYDVKKDEEGRYALYLKKYDGEQYYFRKDGNKYYLESPAEYSTIWVKTNDYRKITLDKDTKCVYSSDSNDEKKSTVSNVFSKKLYWGGYFKFTFKNGKCVSVNEYVTGH